MVARSSLIRFVDERKIPAQVHTTIEDNLICLTNKTSTTLITLQCISNKTYNVLAHHPRIMLFLVVNYTRNQWIIVTSNLY